MCLPSTSQLVVIFGYLEGANKMCFEHHQGGHRNWKHNITPWHVNWTCANEPALGAEPGANRLEAALSLLQPRHFPLCVKFTWKEESRMSASKVQPKQPELFGKLVLGMGGAVVTSRSTLYYRYVALTDQRWLTLLNFATVL